MKPLSSAGTPVPLARVLREYRAALLPLGLVLAINAVVLGAVVLPLSQRVEANEARADAANREQTTAATAFKQAQDMREGKVRASTDLETFYKQVLPSDVAAARRMTHVKFQQKAREHGVQFQRSSATEEQLQDSALDRLKVSMILSGDYDDIRALLYELETSPDFFVIDNVALTDGGDSTAPLSLALEVSTYFRSTRTVDPETRSNGR